MSDKVYPATAQRQGGGGLEAVRVKYGDAMVDQIRSWPRYVGNEAAALGFHAERIEELVAEAQSKVERAGRDRDYALVNAESISRWVPKAEWGIVPPTRWFQDRAGITERNERSARRAAEAGEHRLSFATIHEVVEYVTKPVPE